MQNKERAILYTKLYRPRRRATSVACPRLRTALDQGMDGGWVLVVAAAGMGKTTLVVDWTESCVERTCWLSLDHTEDDPTRFFAYLFAAIEQRTPHVVEGLAPLLQVAHRESFDDVVDALLNRLEIPINN